MRRATRLVVLLFAAACGGDGPTDPRRLDVRIDLDVRMEPASLVERTIEVLATYRRANGERIALVSTPATLKVGAGQATQQSITVQAAPCLSDATRANPTSGCPLTITLRMANGAGAVLATNTFDVTVKGGEQLPAPAVRIAEPSLLVAAAAVQFRGTSGQPTAPAQSIAVTMDVPSVPIGTLSASVRYATGDAWLTASPDGSNGAVSIRPSTSALAAGTYSATVTVSSSTDGVRPQSIAVTYIVAPPPQKLTVLGAGAGGGKVVTSLGGIDCSMTAGVLAGSCDTTLPFGSTVTLSAVALGGSTFVGWTGACSGKDDCTVTLDQGRTVTATFETPKTLTVAVAGSGSGTITSLPEGLRCNVLNGSLTGSCTASFPFGTVVSVRVSPAPGGHGLGGWSGDCSGTGECQLTMDRPRSVTARIVGPPSITVTFTGGQGSVVSSPAGIACPSTASPGSGGCSAPFTFNTLVTLTAVPATGYQFAGWGGDCSGLGPCTVRVDQPRVASARFTGVPETLTIKGSGDGIGVITSSPAGIDCTINAGVASGTCTAMFSHGDDVVLTATGSGIDFLGSWSGICAGALKCQLAMTDPQTITAQFLRGPTPASGCPSTSFSYKRGTPFFPGPSIGCTIYNGGHGYLSGVTLLPISYGPGASGWLDLTLTPNSPPVDFHLTMGIRPLGLLPGTYTATITVASSNGQSATMVADLTIDPPELSVTPTTLTFSATANGALPAAQGLTYANVGRGTIADLGTVLVAPIGYGFGPYGWLTVTPTPGAPGFTVRPSTTALPLGTHTATVLFGSTKGGIVEVTVRYTIQ
jgi:hypothetical protein